MASRALLVCLALCLGVGVASAATRTYYVQAEKVWHSMAEDSERGLWISNQNLKFGTDNCTNGNYSYGAELYMQVGVGPRYLHAKYIRYMDDTFQTPYEIPAEEDHLSILGPIFRVAEGDTLEIVFQNTLDFEVNLVPNGVPLAENDTEPVAPGESKTYSWNITSEMAPKDGETSSKVYIYRSSVDYTVHQNMGLVGGMLVTRADLANADGRPTDTDIEFIMMFHVFDENTNLYFNETLEYYNLTDPLAQSNQTDANWEEANLKHAINGKMYCWNKGFVIPRGKRARWHAFVVGGEPDIHNFHWHGMVLNYSGSFTDQVSLFSMGSVDADMVTDNPGTWMVHCHVNDHIHAGMVGLYTLEGDPIVEKDQGDVHQYYIASNEVWWDYTPSMMDLCGPEPQEFDDDAAGILVPSNLSIVVGHYQLKALFEEYTDNTFTTKKPKDPSLGMLGPTLRAKVGDTIKVTLKNNCRFTTSLHPHGVLYSKGSEGSPYYDGSSDAQHLDDHVLPGASYTYTWYVVDRSAPGALDGSSIVWMYHSHTHEIQDSYAGLQGAIVIVRPEMANEDMTPKDVDREYVLFFSITDEKSSFMLRQNLATAFPSMPNLQYASLVGGEASFGDSESFHNINGYMFCNGPGFNATVGERVRFYLLSLGTEADLHTPSSSLQWRQQTADIIPRAAGDFKLQCKTAEHVKAGMIAHFHVEDDGSDPLDKFNGTERKYYISADIEEWNYVPDEIEACSGEPFDDETAAQWGDGTMGSSFLKAVYREYTDETFTERKPQMQASDGMAGPTIIAEVGDLITVVFQNNVTFEANLQLSGGFVPLHDGDLVDGPVENGTTVTYQWVVNEDNGPGENDLSTIAFKYGSNVDPVGDLYAGLFGAVVIARGGSLNKTTGLPVGIDNLIPLFFNGVDESASSLFDDNVELANFTVPDSLTEYDDYEAWTETTTWQTINGYVWCRQPDVVLNVSSTVRWVLVGLGGETGLYSPVFENALLLAQGRKVVTTEIAPTVTMNADMTAQFPGTWNYHCDVQEHYEGGMQGKYIIQDPNEQSRFNSNSSRRRLRRQT